MQLSPNHSRGALLAGASPVRDVRCDEFHPGRDGALRAEEMRRAVEMRAKCNPFLVDFTELVQAENLEAAGIGQDRPRPRHETMQPAQLAVSTPGRR